MSMSATAGPASIRFFGAVGEVTGSLHLLELGEHRVLLDCGAWQGESEPEDRPEDAFPLPPTEIDAVVLSHAHIDHCGRLPVLVRHGFRGPIWCQHGTADLVPIMLRDSARLAEGDAERENKRRAREGRPPIEPLFTVADAERVLSMLRPLRYLESREILAGVQLCLHEAGHIIGSATVEIGYAGRVLLYSGDLGQRGMPILRDPKPPARADLVLMESTYGDRLHRPRADTVVEIGALLERAARDGGNVLIPAFAVGRTQEVLHWLTQHYEDWNIARWRVILDSPMAIEASAVYAKHPELYDEESQAALRSGRSWSELPNLEHSVTTQDSIAINEIRSGAIIIAGSGMCTGGRIRHHLFRNLARRECHVMIVGYQAWGTLGRLLVDGVPRVKLFGEQIPVRARIHTVGGLSAHADQQGLLNWYASIEGRPPVYLVHGEDRARRVLAERLEAELDATVHLPSADQRVDWYEPGVPVEPSD